MNKQPLGTEPSPSEANHRHASLLSDASLFGVALIWGINIPLMKIGLEQIDVYLFNAVRLTISAIVLTACARREIRKHPDKKTTLSRRSVFLYAIMVSGVYQVLFLIGMARTTSGNTALIIATVPIWTALMARAFIGEVLHKLAWCGLVIALVGTVVVALQKGDVSVAREQLIGNLLILGSAIIWSAGTVYSRSLLKQITPLQLASTSALIALPIHYLLTIGRWEGGLAALAAPGLLLIILYSGTFSSGLSQPMWHYGVRHAGAAHAAVVQNAIPLVAIIAAWLIRGEVMTGPQAIGGGLIIAGLITMRWKRNR